MKNLLLLSLLIALFTAAANAQETRVEPVPGMPPMSMGPGAFENLTMPASMDRFGELKESDLKQHVNIFLSLISPKNTTIEFVVVLNNSEKNLGDKVDWFANYFKSKKVVPERYSFAFGPTANGQTELWYVPNSNISLPTDPSRPPFKIIGGDDPRALKDLLASPPSS